MACTEGILKRERSFRRACLGGGNKWRLQTARPKEIRPHPHESPPAIRGGGASVEFCIQGSCHLLLRPDKPDGSRKKHPCETHSVFLQSTPFELARMIHGLANCFANVYAFKRLRSLLEKQSAY
ncbi:hypothetical protein Q31b_44180 [Novipirellula aureliae]|uniref:Uncharacterized protein n=1 Tax=Novipirellula aureliae TaxID=2527966 RepID=A0A5C6DLE0_9BACT|nr:hypothetical protein Q31b_44180 [Novipirellula aureliae]